MLTLGLYLDELHSWVLRFAIVHAISKITEPRTRTSAPHLLDSGVVVAAGHGFAGDRNPVLIATVLEGNGNGTGVLLNVVEFLAVRVGEEQEVGTCPLGHRHGTVDGSCALSKSTKKANLELVYDAVEITEFCLG